MKYAINQKQLTCINILIRTLQEAINRECFSEQEVEKIIKTVSSLNDYRFDLKPSNFS